MIEVSDAGQVLAEATHNALLRLQMPTTDRARFWTLVTAELEGFRLRDQVDPKLIDALIQGLRTPMVR